MNRAPVDRSLPVPGYETGNEQPPPEGCPSCAATVRQHNTTGEIHVRHEPRCKHIKALRKRWARVTIPAPREEDQS